MPKTVTSNNVNVYYCTEKKVCRTSDGTIHVIVFTASTVAHHHSHDNGDNWSSVNIWSSLPDLRTCAIDADGNDNLVAARYDLTNSIIFKKGTVNKSDPNHWVWTWGGEKTLNSGDITYHPDIIADGNNYYHIIAYCPQQKVYWWRSIDGGVNWIYTEVTGWYSNYSIATITKDSANNLYIFATYSDGNNKLQACKITYSAGPSWSVGSVVDVATGAAGQPSANVLSDNRLIVSYANNPANGGNCRFRKSTNPSDITTWNAVVDIASGVVSTTAHSLAKYADTKIRVYYIKNNFLHYRESTDGGVSFGTQQTEYSTGTNNNVNCAKKTINGKLDFVWANGTGSSYIIFLNTISVLMGWLSGWTYRKSHIINKQVGAGTNYQIGIKVYKTTGTDGTETVNGVIMGKVYVGSNCRDDFGDIRFTDDDGTTLLDYWIESYTSGTSAIFWIEVKDNLTDGNITIYVYYGKTDGAYPHGVDQTEMDATFIFADHFYGSSLDLTKWVVTFGTPTVSSSYVHFQGVHRIRSINAVAQTNSMTRFRSNVIVIASPLISITDSTVSYPVGNNSAFYHFGESKTKTVKDGNIESKSWTRSTGEKTYDIYRDSTINVVFIRDGSIINTHNIYIPTVDLKPANSCDSGDHMDWNYVFVRKYVSPEPVHSAWGNQEEYMLEIARRKIRRVPLTKGDIIFIYRGYGALEVPVVYAKNVEGKIRNPVNRLVENVIGTMNNPIVVNKEIEGKLRDNIMKEYIGSGKILNPIKKIYEIAKNKSYALLNILLEDD